MGSVHMAHCTCGFEAEIAIGGSMRDFNNVAYFPHYCEKCGLVDANIAKAEGKGLVPPCPKCGSNDLHEYGAETTCRPVNDNQITLLCGTLQAMENGNLCPSCKKMTLTFDGMPSILFDSIEFQQAL